MKLLKKPLSNIHNYLWIVAQCNKIHTQQIKKERKIHLTPLNSHLFYKDTSKLLFPTFGPFKQPFFFFSIYTPPLDFDIKQKVAHVQNSDLKCQNSSSVNFFFKKIKIKIKQKNYRWWKGNLGISGQNLHIRVTCTPIHSF